MNSHDEQELRELLKEAIAPVAYAELRRDLWPEMRRKLDKRQPLQISWFDWLLAAILGAGLFFFPQAIPALLYHM